MHLVTHDQAALLHATQIEFVDGQVLRRRIDQCIQIGVRHHQLDQSALG